MNKILGDNKVRSAEVDGIRRVADWQRRGGGMLGAPPGGGMLGRGQRTPSCEALKGAVTDLYRIDDFDLENLGSGFFSDVFKVTHRTTGKVMVLKMNKDHSNRPNMLKEIQLMNRLRHPNILRFEAVCVHEGQLHALTEYVEGGTLEELIQNSNIPLSWTLRMELGHDIAQGLVYLNKQGMFHRDLTSKNIFIKKSGPRMTAIVGDFGLATRIPGPGDPRLPTVGSPYWMSPECLKGEQPYGQQADIFSFGIILCEMIARVDSDPDILPRTQNFGVEYKAFSALCPDCPPDFLKLCFTCVSIDPSSRPTAPTLVSQLTALIDQQKTAELVRREGPSSLTLEPSLTFKKPIVKRFLSENEGLSKKSPSDKARIHHRSFSAIDHTAETVGEEMCLLDPYYQPPPHNCVLNPFATMPRLSLGRKIIGSTSELFSSCFELPSPRVSSPTESPPSHINTTRSAPNSPPSPQRGLLDTLPFLQPSSSTPRFARYGCMSQDDSSLGTWTTPPHSYPIRRWGSCESGFYSVSNDDWVMEGCALSNRSIGSSLLTVSDLEEDLRAASVLLSNKRTSSVFTDSLDDLSSRLDEISSTRGSQTQYLNDGYKPEKYEKDIRDIVEYFEKNCHINRRIPPGRDTRTSPEIARSQKIESLIKRVAENKNRARFGRSFRPPNSQQHLQVCDGIVRSKLPLFDQTKRQTRGRLPFNQQGFVKARLALFDKPQPKPGRKLVSDFMVRQRELRNLKTSSDLQLQSKVSKLSSELQNPTRTSDKSSTNAVHSANQPNTSKKF